MQISWLYTFLDVSESRNFHRTAERLQITQSTVSVRIRSLENELGTQLFIRGRGGADLTSEGVKLLNYANNIRLNWNSALKELKGPKDYRGSVKIATQMSIWEQLVNEWLIEIRSALPRVAINIQADYSATMVKDLLSGQLDIAVLYAPEYQPSFEVEHLYDEEFIMLATEPLNLSQVRQENYVFVGLTDYFIQRHAELLPHLNSPAICMSLNIMTLEYLKKNGGAAYFSKSQVKELIKEQSLYRVEGSPVIEQPVFVAYLSKYRHSVLVTGVLKALKNTIAR